MKKVVINFSFTVITLFSFSQTAPQISTNDCKDTPYNLYDKLNQGKIIVIGWAMPCLSCAPALLEVNNAVLNFAVSNPNTVEFWLADDFANTSCSSLETWSANTGLTMAVEFSTSAINMNDFGSIGMPKVVVIGCNGKVYYNVDNTPNGTGVTSAINTALGEINSGCLNEINEINKDKIILFPNPVNDNVLSLTWNSLIKFNSIQLINIDGKLIKEYKIFNNQLNYDIDMDKINSGIYELLILDNNKVIDRKKCIVE